MYSVDAQIRLREVQIDSLLAAVGLRVGGWWLHRAEGAAGGDGRRPRGGERRYAASCSRRLRVDGRRRSDSPRWSAAGRSHHCHEICGVRVAAVFTTTGQVKADSPRMDADGASHRYHGDILVKPHARRRSPFLLRSRSITRGCPPRRARTKPPAVWK
ncbi:unnamed protein product [Urochloa humidicola]